MVSDDEPLPTLVLNPPDDEAFRSLAEGLIRDGVERPEELQTALRAKYSHALVRPRELAGEQAHVWYVYRDGHWIRPAR